MGSIPTIRFVLSYSFVRGLLKEHVILYIVLLAEIRASCKERIVIQGEGEKELSHILYARQDSNPQPTSP